MMTKRQTRLLKRLTPSYPMPVGLENWYFQIPVITRSWISACILLGLAVVSAYDGFIESEL